MPGEPAEVSHGPQLRATHPHAPGARMTVVKQTPSNKKIAGKYFSYDDDECVEELIKLAEDRKF